MASRHRALVGFGGGSRPLSTSRPVSQPMPIEFASWALGTLADRTYGMSQLVTKYRGRYPWLSAWGMKKNGPLLVPPRNSTRSTRSVRKRSTALATWLAGSPTPDTESFGVLAASDVSFMPWAARAGLMIWSEIRRVASESLRIKPMRVDGVKNPLATRRSMIAL